MLFSGAQVWNMNHVNGVVMAANVQGSCWDRRRHCFATHEVQPPPLQATVRPHDVAALPHSGRSGDSRDRFAVYSDRSQQLSLLAGIDGLEVRPPSRCTQKKSNKLNTNADNKPAG